MEEVVLDPVHVDDTTDKDKVQKWLANFERALRSGDRSALAALFAEECHWRDLLAFTWTINPHVGLKNVVDGLIAAQARVQPRNFVIAKGRSAPRRLKRAGVEVNLWAKDENGYLAMEATANVAL